MNIGILGTGIVGQTLAAALAEKGHTVTIGTRDSAATLMVKPDAVNGGDHTLFVCGNDADAKEPVKRWLGEWFGWREFVDLGDVTASRGTEMYLPLWLRTWGALGSPMSNVKIVR